METSPDSELGGADRRRYPFCCWPDCDRPPTAGSRACEYHVGIYASVRESLSKPQELGPVKRRKTVRRLLCGVEGCDEPRVAGGDRCLEHAHDN